MSERTCAYQHCDNALKPRQDKYCSRSCAAHCNVRTIYLNKNLPTDDQIWANEHCTWAKWSKQTGIGRASISKRMTDRGWKRKVGEHSAFTHAPCKGCGGSHAIVDLNRNRLCAACEADEEVDPTIALLRHERARRIEPDGDRYDQWLRLPLHVVRTRFALPGRVA